MTARAFLAAALLVCLCTAPADAKVIRHRKLAFTLRIPDEAIEFPEGKQGPDMVYSYLLGVPAEDDHMLFFTIERMRGTIGRSTMTKEEIARERAKRSDHPMVKIIPPDAAFDLFDATWNGFDIQVWRMRATMDDVAVVVYIAQIPLRHEAIQIAVGCGDENATEGRRLMKALLAGLDGKSNWTPGGGVLPSPADEQTKKKWDKILDDLSITAVIAMIVIIVVLRKRKRAREAKQAADSPPPPPVGPPWPGPDEHPRPPSQD